MKQFHEQYKNQIKDLADRMRGDSMPSLTEELFALFETTGNRLKYEDVYFARRKFLAVFGIAAYVFKRRQDVIELEEVLEEICKEECWALPAHVNRRDNPEWRNTVDLFASETAQALAEIVVLINGSIPGESKLSDAVCERVKSEIERRVLIPFEQNKQGWECSDHNWNAVCGGSVGSAAMYLLAGKEDVRLEKILKRICHSLTFYLGGFREDGTCMEGIGYFTYGMTYFIGFAEQLLRCSNGKLNLFDNKKVRKIAEFQQKMYFSSGQTVSFSDGDTSAKFRLGLTAFLAKQYDTVQIPNMEYAADFETDSCYRFMGLLRDYLWTKGLEDGKTTRENFVTCARQDVLSYAQWSICESRNGVGFAIKGGDNGEPHNHNDVGSFLYLVNGEQLICDLGAGEYTAEYFGEGRYKILCNSSEGHSVPVVDGKFQKDGAIYKASFFEADGKGGTRIEFSGAYEEGTVKKLTREAALSLENGTLVITDSFIMDRAEDTNAMSVSECFAETLITKGMVSLDGNTLLLQGETASCKIQIEGNIEDLRVQERIHFTHEGDQETVRLVRWNVIPEINKGEKGEYYHGVSKYIVWQC